MAHIKILPAHEAQKIAAGEVVERPANVVKELIENALDAGATTITLHIAAAGKELIRIIDNGSGMSPEDAQLSILPHATSKIRSVDELTTLATFGFRGEALAALAAVSKMEIITKQEAACEAVQLIIEAGSIIAQETVAANDGTDISIKELFFNVPARKKFLKTEKTEWHAIQQLVYAYALDYPNIQFTLYHNQNLVLSCSPCAHLTTRAQQIFDQQITEHLLTVSSSTQTEIMIDGLISDHQYGRYDRSHIYLFVNKRWVKNHKLAAAIIKGYQGVLQQGHYPCAIISITVPLHTVDINIHPRKEEVQFLHPRIIEEALSTLVKTRLGSHIAQRIQQPRTSTVNYQPYQSFAPQPTFIPVTAGSYQAPQAQHFTAPSPTTTLQQIAEQPFRAEESVVPQQEFLQQSSTIEEPSYTIKGQLDATYIMLDTPEGLMLIDQHAAHERILYEQIGARMSHHESVQLLFPETIRLAAHDYSCLVENLSLLQKFGIQAEPWSENQILVTATPMYLKVGMLKDIIAASAATLAQEGNTLTEIAHKKVMHAVQAMIACKAAVKAHDILQPEEMQSLIKQLYTLEERLTCPHGRPTSWLVSFAEIERKFKRIL
jgi:DNA mismatch repair protein MutL